MKNFIASFAVLAMLFTGTGLTTAKASATPSIISLSPSSGTKESKIMIIGSGFEDTNDVHFDFGGFEDVLSPDGISLVFPVPAVISGCTFWAYEERPCNLAATPVVPGFHQVSVSNSKGASDGAIFTVSQVLGTTTSTAETVQLVLDGRTVYQIAGGERQGFPTPAVFFSHGYSFDQVVRAEADDLALPEGEVLTYREGTLVKLPSDPTVYIVSEEEKRPFTSKDVFIKLGYQFSSVLVDNSAEVAKLPPGLPIASANAAHPPGSLVNFDGTICKIISTGRVCVPSRETFESHGYDFNKVVPANEYDLPLPETARLAPRPPVLAPLPIAAPAPTSTAPVTTPLPPEPTATSTTPQTEPSGTVSSNPGNSSLMVQTRTTADNYSLVLSDPDGIGEFLIKPASGCGFYYEGVGCTGAIWGGEPKTGNTPCPTSMNNSFWLAPSDFPLQGYVIDCTSSNTKYTVSASLPGSSNSTSPAPPTSTPTLTSSPTPSTSTSPTSTTSPTSSSTASSTPSTTSSTTDSSPPAISGITVSNITQNSATISWTTDEPADSQIYYGATTSYGSVTSLISTLTTSHDSDIGSLSAATTYYFQVLSRDATGNLSTSAGQSFTTLGTISSGPDNSSLTVQRRFPGQYDNIKYSLTVSDPDGIDEYLIKTAGGSGIVGGGGAGDSICYTSNTQSTSPTVDLFPSDFPLQGYVIDCANPNIKYTVSAAMPALP